MDRRLACWGAMMAGAGLWAACSSGSAGHGTGGDEADASPQDSAGGDGSMQDTGAAAGDSAADAPATADGKAGAGGASDAGDPLAATNGSRISVWQWRSADGFVAFDTLYDTQTQEPCYPLVADDGTSRCLPSAVYPSGLFAEATCTQPAYAAPKGMGSKYVQTTVPGLCSNATAPLALRGAALTTVYQSTSGSCTSVTVDMTQTDYFAAGVPVAATHFVAFSKESVPIASGIVALVDVGADGTRNWTGEGGLFDTTRDAQATILRGSDDALHAMPAPETAVGLYSDPSCTTGLFTLGLCETPAGFGVTATTAGCNQDVRVFAWGQPYDGGLYALVNGDACAPSFSNYPMYTTGIEVAASSTPEAQAVTVGGSRLTGDTYRLGAVVLPITIGEAHDAANGETCGPAPAADGKLRCLPTTAADGFLYLDSACTQAVAQRQKNVGACDPPKSQFVRSLGGNVLHIYRAGSVVASPPLVYTLNTQGLCTPSPMDPDLELVQIGPEVAPSTFAEMTVGP